MKYLFSTILILISLAFTPPKDSKIAILKFHKAYHLMFDSSSKNAKLTLIEIKNVQVLLTKCVAEYNSSLIKDKIFDTINVSNYNKQLVAVIVKNGEKQVFVNCICERDIPQLKKSGYNWRTDTFKINDGGNCYFHVFINLTKNSYRNLRVNGMQ